MEEEKQTERSGIAQMTERLFCKSGLNPAIYGSSDKKILVFL